MILRRSLSASVSDTLPISDWGSLQNRLIWCYSGAVDPAGRRGTSGVEENVAWLLLQGRVSIRHRRAIFRAEKGQWLIPPVGKVEREFSDDARLVSICFSARWPDGRHLFDEGLPLIFPTRWHPRLRDETLRLAREVGRRFVPHDTRLGRAQVSADKWFQLSSLYQGWLAAFTGALVAQGLTPARLEIDDERVRRGLFLIEQCPIDQKFPKADVAHRLGLSGSQLDRIFVRHLGFTPKAHFERRRQNQARTLLALGTLRIKEIAYRLGFDSASHFSMWFHRATDLSPRRFAALPEI